MMEKEKEELLKQAKELKEKVKDRGNSLKAKRLEKIELMRKELEALKLSMQKEKNKLGQLNEDYHTVCTEVDSMASEVKRDDDGNIIFNFTDPVTEPPRSKPAAEPVQRKTTSAPREVPLVQDKLLDPSLATYAARVAASAGVTPNPTPAPALNPTPTPAPAVSIPGLGTQDAASILSKNPYLAAACNIAASGDETVKQTDGKSAPEGFIFRDSNLVGGKPKVSFNEFVHGCMRLLHIRLSRDHLPVDGMVKYYEVLFGFATDWDWPAVYYLHSYIANEVENERRQWQDDINYTTALKYLNKGKQLAEDQGFGDKGSRRDRRRREGGSHRHDFRDDSRGSGSRERNSDTCDRFNRSVEGCRFGANCKYKHKCEICNAKGLRENHSALYCQMISGNGDQNDSGQGHRGGPGNKRK